MVNIITVIGMTGVVTETVHSEIWGGKLAFIGEDLGRFILNHFLFPLIIPVSQKRNAPHAPNRFAPPNEDLTSVIYRILNFPLDNSLIFSKIIIGT